MAKIDKHLAYLHDVADKLDTKGMHAIARGIRAKAEDIRVVQTRKRNLKAAKKSSRTITTELAQEIRAFGICHPQVPQHSIAALFNVNPGRVSEALRGLR